MNKNLLLFVFIYVSLFSAFLKAQEVGNSNILPFDETKVVNELKSLGYSGKALSEKFTEKKQAYYSSKGITGEQHKPTENVYFDNGGNDQVMAACSNVDFELGNRNGWSGCTGYHQNYISSGPCASNGFVNNRHFITSGTGTDPCGGFPVVAPGGSYSLRLGNNGAGGEGEEIRQTFTVTAANSNFTYQYAVVFQNPNQPHTLGEQPFFESVMFDQSGNAIPCSYYYVASSQAANIGFSTSTLCTGSDPVLYKAWTSVFVDLTAQIGQNVTIRFRNADCSLGAHYGYAYIDASCSTFGIILSDTLCGSNPSTLTAPVGANGYLWDDGSTTRTRVVTTPGNYCVTLNSYQGCTKQLCKDVIQYPLPAAQFTSSAVSCGILNTNLTDLSTVSSGSINDWKWNFGDSNTDTQQNPSHIYATGGTYNVKLVIKSAEGCRDSITKPITLGLKPVPAFSSAPVCYNTTSTFVDASTSSEPITAWFWDFNDPASGANNTSNAASPSHDFTSAGVFNVKLVTTAANGCKDSVINAITINPSPTVVFQAPPICLGETTLLTDQSTINSGTIASLTWDFGDPASGINNTSTASNPTHQYASAGIYTVSLTATSDLGCIATAAQNVQVYDKPIANFSTANACVNSPVTFTDFSTVAAGNTINNWLWNYGDATPDGTTQNSTHTYVTAGNYTITQYITTDKGCKDTIQSNITVYPNATPNFTAPALCLTNATLFANSSIPPLGGTIASYTWNFGDASPVDNTTSPTHTYTADGTYQVTLTVTSDNNCISSTTRAVTVHPLPVAAFNNPSVCFGSPNGFTDQSTINSGSITSFDWNFGDATPSATGSSVSHNYTAAGTYTVMLIVTSNNGCKDTIDKPTFVVSKPEAKFIVSGTEACANTCITFTDSSSVIAGVITNWLWAFGDGTTATTKSPIKCYNTPGNFNVQLIVKTAENCADTAVSSGAIVISPAPTANFITNPTRTTILNTIVDFFDQSSSDVIKRKWFFGDGDSLVPGTLTPRHTYPIDVEGTYTAKLTVENQYGCVDTVEHDIIIGPDWTFYIPNAFSPNGDGVNDFFNGKGLNILQYEMLIFDRWGDMIFQTNDLAVSWDGKANKGSKQAQQDVYIYQIILRDVFNKQHKYVGHVTLVR